MRHVRLGRTGLRVSQFCLGTATFGSQCDEVTSHAVLDRALEAGVTFIDTADKYPLGGSLDSNGRTETIVGRWLRGRRDRVILATKFNGPMGPAAWDQGNSRKHVLDAVNGSLRRLGTDYIDLYQVHRPDPETPIEETLAALDDIVKSGKVRYVGLLELSRIPGCARAGGQRPPTARAVRRGPTLLQPAVPPIRARAVAARGGGGHGRASVQPVGWGAVDG